MLRWTPREVMRSAGPPGRQAVRDSRATRGGPSTSRSTAGMPESSPNTRVESFILSGYNGKPTRGTVTIHAFDREQRVRRACAGLGKWWGVALLCVFIPVAHFVLVPSFLAYGLWQRLPALSPTSIATYS